METESWEVRVCCESASVLVIDADLRARAEAPLLGNLGMLGNNLIYVFGKIAVFGGSSEAFFSILEEKYCRCCLCLYSLSS